VLRLPRTPGARESRWAQLLCGPVDAAAVTVVTAGANAAGADASSLAARVAALEAEVGRLRADLQTLKAAGMSLPGHAQSNDRA